MIMHTELAMIEQMSELTIDGEDPDLLSSDSV